MNNKHFNILFFIIYLNNNIQFWGLGIGDWGLGVWGFGIRGWDQTQLPNSPNPTPIPQPPFHFN